MEYSGDPRQGMRIALVDNLAPQVGALESGGKISGKPLARFFNNYHGGNDDERETNKANVERCGAKNILYARCVTNQKYEGNFKNKR